MNIREWREKSSGEREKAMLELTHKARQVYFDVATKESKNHSAYRKIKKDIARLLTLKSEEAIRGTVPSHVK